MRTVSKKNTKSFSFKMWVRRIWIFFWILCFVCFSAFCIWGWHSGYIKEKYELFKKEYHETMGNAGFVLNDILVKGRVRTERTDIRNALNLPIDNLILTFDLNQMQENLSKLPWVKYVSVTRQLPDILFIQLIERQPIALWQDGNDYFPLDEDGNIINTTCEECFDLPIIVGEKAPKATPAFIDTLKGFESIEKRLVSAAFINERRWNLYIDDIQNGIIVLLPESDLKASLKRLEDLQNKEKVFEKDIEKIDLRFADKIIIKPKSKDAITLPQDGGKK